MDWLSDILVEDVVEEFNKLSQFHRSIERGNQRNKTSTRSAQLVTNTIVNRGPANAVVKNTTLRLSPEVYEYRKINHLCFRGIEAEINMNEINTYQEEDEPPDVMI
ncbi:hypothetical protein KY285_021176 [Solanum tuberosum]|nr:hypothetical protein KY285_021176 [Solanum tuberosum]